MDPFRLPTLLRRTSTPKRTRSVLWIGVVLVIAAGCTAERDPLFSRLDAERTGVDFVNSITTDDSLMNPVDFFYVYNGGGVGAGDLNGDGRTDLYFSGNTGPNGLYLNEGDFEFRDVTEKAGVAADGVWATGVTLVDINQDGRTDIYVSVGGPRARTEDRDNRLYVNQGSGDDGVPVFKERAEAYGIADSGYSTHAAFFDYDRDGDLDLYVLNTATVQRGPAARRGNKSARSGGRDRLYRNEGNGTFVEVTDEAGIGGEGYGLGIAISDVNGDGWSDVYTANDLHTRDRLYVNQGDGTFVERSRAYFRHQSFSSMGVDIADVNNDARNDIFVLDMLPQDPQRRRLISNAVARRDEMWQYGWNTLQLNNGRVSDRQVPFSEIGHLANVEATGWSWAPLLADYDNDGDRDLFVSNGYGELVTHLDFVKRRRQAQFSGRREQRHASLIEAMEDLPRVDIANRFFENVGASGEGERLQFADRTGDWATRRPGISNGAAFADLDRDGDLDLVTNNINREATILENHADERKHAHALRVDLHGPEGNRSGLGAKVTLINGGTTQYEDYSPYRGYQSTVEGIVHFGLGADSTADSLEVVWPDGTKQVRTEVEAGRVLNVYYDSVSASSERPDPREGPRPSAEGREEPLFREVASARRGLDYRHRDSDVSDFQINPLLPHRYSRNGPGIAVGDVDGNGLDDVFVGADPLRKRVLYRQVEPGQFRREPFPIDRNHEDMGALFFDADGDGDPDLYVVSGGNVGPPDNRRNTYQDRLYLNDGEGNFSRAEDALPDITASGSVVTAADYDGDGDLDLFVGGRVRARHYPLPPRSYLLRNDTEEGEVQFTDVTAEAAPNLVEPGLVTDALWTDFNDDGRVDLIVVGEWMRIRFFENEGGTFTEVTEDTGLQNTSGWWNSLAAGDFDRDGDTDYVVGNLGLNTRYEATPSEPVRVHAKDFGGDGSIDPILSYTLEGTRYPAHGRQELIDRLTGLFSQYPTQQVYAGATFHDVFTQNVLADAYEEEAVRFETSYLENEGDGTFTIRSLPRRVQTAPVFGMRAGDYTGDGVLDLLLVGNWYAPDRETGRADAFVGAVLRGDGTGQFEWVDVSSSNFVVEGDAKGLAEIATGDGNSLVLATQNDDSLEVFSPRRRSGRRVEVPPSTRSAELVYRDGSVRKEEFYAGSTYLSQSSSGLWVPTSVEEVRLHGPDGAHRTVEADSLSAPSGVAPIRSFDPWGETERQVE